MRFVLALVISLNVVVANGAKVSDELKVTLTHGGGVIGKYTTSHRGHGIRAFLGVPFAEPPVGPLRFANPHPKAAWTGFVEATTFADDKICPQPNALAFDEVIGDEDCLYLNVYTPTVRAR